MNCSNPIDAAVLADYWVAALAKPEEEAVEEHLLNCDRCGTRLREMISLAEGVRRLAREGSLRMVVSDAFLQRAAEEGLRVREYAPAPGGSVECTVTAEDDILIGRLAANLSGSSSVAYQESITFAKAAPTNKMIARLVTFEEGGGERLLGEYIFNHTRSLPGPGAW
ncbi:MAG: hypothetical protein HY235_06340 [Acidobacteria bacterium]|nr:hypothetical protein [Acidobacteriota bacterium]